MSTDPPRAQEALPTLSRKVRVETLPPYHTRLDVSPPAAMSYNLMEWLKETSPPFTAVHFVSPFLAHYATLARQQGLALTRTSLVAHFLYALAQPALALPRRSRHYPRACVVTHCLLSAGVTGNRPTKCLVATSRDKPHVRCCGGVWGAETASGTPSPA